MFLPSHKPFLALASPFLLLSLATAMQQSHPFLAGDVWRGHLSSCSAIKSFGKNDVHVVDMTVVEGTPSSLKAMFTEQTTKSQYVMHGQYSASTLAFTLTFGEWIHQPKESSWIPCDAVGVVDRSMSVITGDAVCSSKPGKTASKEKCQYAGGGEFVLRHDRTSFTVEGAGDTSVNGEYSSIPKDHDLFKSETYEGVPLYSQVTCDPMSATPPRARGCDNKHVMAQRIVGVQKFWIITDVGSLHLHDHMDYDSEVEGSEVFDSIKYSVWSEEVTPPVLGWRVRGHREAASPAPMINPVIGSMMHLEGMVHPMTVEKRMKDMLVQDGVVTEDGGMGVGGYLLVVVLMGFVFAVWKKKKGGSRRR